jgi:hypothetical protein
LCVAVFAAVAAAGVAFAGGIPGPDGVIHACRKVEGGALRAVRAGVHCRAGERALRWNVKGVAGPQGPVGPQGPPGPQGEPGPGLASFDQLAGLPCTAGAGTGAIELAYEAGTGVATIRCAVQGPPPAQVRINEFSTGIEGALTDEFVELVNAGATAVDLSGYKLVYRSAAGTSDVSLGALPDGTTLAAGAFMLFGGSGYAGAHPADRSFSTSLSSSGGGLGLRDPNGDPGRLGGLGHGDQRARRADGRPSADDRGLAGQVRRAASRRPRHERQLRRLHGRRSDTGRSELGGSGAISAVPPEAR